MWKRENFELNRHVLFILACTSSVEHLSKAISQKDISQSPNGLGGVMVLEFF